MSEGRAFHVPAVVTHLVDSRFAGQTYQIQVMQPMLKVADRERFPVVYLTDANLAFDFAKAISHCLQSRGEVRRYILVGIGYPGDNPFAGDILRCRDLTARGSTEISGLPHTSPIVGVLGFKERGRAWGGADEFLDFIEKELIPLIDDTYPTVSGERTYFGHSLGGCLGLHALLTRPDIFKAYVLSSPGISFAGDDFHFREAQQCLASGTALNAKLFMSIGDREGFEVDVGGPQLVSDFYRLANLFGKGSVQGLDFACQVIPGETHLSVWPIAFSHGVQAILGAGEALPPG